LNGKILWLAAKNVVISLGFVKGEDSFSRQFDETMGTYVSPKCPECGSSEFEVSEGGSEILFD
jgi:hypothetical protein